MGCLNPTQEMNLGMRYGQRYAKTLQRCKDLLAQNKSKHGDGSVGMLQSAPLLEVRIHSPLGAGNTGVQVGLSEYSKEMQCGGRIRVVPISLCFYGNFENVTASCS